MFAKGGECVTERRFLGAALYRQTLCPYDIVKKEANNFVWVEAARDIQSAKKRVHELARHSDDEFVIFNEHTLQVIETFETPIGS